MGTTMTPTFVPGEAVWWRLSQRPVVVVEALRLAPDGTPDPISGTPSYLVAYTLHGQDRTTVLPASSLEKLTG